MNGNDLIAIKYFEIALDNIRNIDVSDERKVNRAKRLALMPSFNKWMLMIYVLKNKDLIIFN